MFAWTLCRGGSAGFAPVAAVRPSRTGWERSPAQTQAAGLHDRQGSFWLQTSDQSGRRSAFLQQEQQKFNLDRLHGETICSKFKLTMLTRFR